jgi:hypothetical protein
MVPRARGSVAEWLKMLCRGNKDDDHLGLARRKDGLLLDSAWEFLATHSLFSFRPCNNHLLLQHGRFSNWCRSCSIWSMLIGPRAHQEQALRKLRCRQPLTLPPPVSNFNYPVILKAEVESAQASLHGISNSPIPLPAYDSIMQLDFTIFMF